jgi:hypothetical protein
VTIVPTIVVTIAVAAVTYGVQIVGVNGWVSSRNGENKTTKDIPIKDTHSTNDDFC